MIGTCSVDNSQQPGYLNEAGVYESNYVCMLMLMLMLMPIRNSLKFAVADFLWLHLSALVGNRN
jgi:hypothetical protein